MRFSIRSSELYVCTALMLSPLTVTNAQIPEPIFQEKQCMDKGWKREVIQVAGLQRYVLWKAPADSWPRGAIIVLPVSSGDPYGWHRICDASLNKRENVPGAGHDNETRKQIIERNSCQSDAYENEKPWDTSGTNSKPPYRVFRHDKDGINDRSCAMKMSKQLSAHGYPGEEDFVLNGWFRTISQHFWQEEYNEPILDFFARQVAR